MFVDFMMKKGSLGAHEHIQVQLSCTLCDRGLLTLDLLGSNLAKQRRNESGHPPLFSFHRGV